MLRRIQVPEVIDMASSPDEDHTTGGTGHAAHAEHTVMYTYIYIYRFAYICIIYIYTYAYIYIYLSLSLSLQVMITLFALLNSNTVLASAVGSDGLTCKLCARSRFNLSCLFYQDSATSRQASRAMSSGSWQPCSSSYS